MTDCGLIILVLIRWVGVSNRRRSSDPCSDLPLVLDPLEPLSLLPDAAPLIALRRDEDALAVLLAVFPLALVGATVWVGVNAVAVLFVVLVVAFVDAAVGPFVDALAVHVVVEPVALVGSLVFQVYSP